MSKNDLLRSTPHKHQDVVIAGAVVRFDGNGACKGVIRRSGAAHTSDQLGEEPDEITQAILQEAKKRVDEFSVDMDKDGEWDEKPAAKTSTRKRVAAVATPSEDVTAVEVPDAKAITDAA